MTQFNSCICARREGGFSLVEILVTLVILAVGLLGLAALMLDGLRNNQSAYLRTQASILAYDMADRMRVNRDQVAAGLYDDYATNSADATTTLPACASADTGCNDVQQVTLDKAEWTRSIQGTASGVRLLPNGVGTISVDGTGIRTITITWAETQWDEATGEKAVSSHQFSVDFRI